MLRACVNVLQIRGFLRWADLHQPRLFRQGKVLWLSPSVQYFLLIKAVPFT